MSAEMSAKTMLFAALGVVALVYLVPGSATCGRAAATRDPEPRNSRSAS